MAKKSRHAALVQVVDSLHADGVIVSLGHLAKTAEKLEEALNAFGFVLQYRGHLPPETSDDAEKKV